MPFYKIIAIAMIVGGTIGLIYGGFSFTKKNHNIELGPLNMSLDEKEYIGIPIWAGLAGIVIGASMLVMKKQG